ncbi:amino acid adenylation domain-containing protein [Mucilaginibacter pineti]|uniref:Amino acid adenylation domain-containing protein n=1 Tax=Mucilaginibacter pineti TaxID=1391627 RepID=A0A1G6TUM5_9SPHI|nr:non-ribosomal peptide synthetase [Mucilaginibacter pineti]SDD32166.1 amino acid adenylation domain-containing protein [Mucilaginibacter pineti]
MDTLYTYETTPVEFDPFAGPELQLIAPATASQLEIWTSCLIGGDGANCAYNESFSLELTGTLNHDAMLHALQQISNRHEALRSSFSADGKYICIYNELQLEIDYHDLSAQSAVQQRLFIDEHNRQAALIPFDLVNGPLFKTTLLKLGDHQHHLTFTAHHIICDGWSIGIMMQDLSKFYSAYTNNEPLHLPAAPLFSEYAVEQLAFEKSAEYKETESYWLDQFKGSSHALHLPADLPRPAVRTFKSHRDDFDLDAELASALKKLAKANGTSFVTTLLAAFELFLQRISGQEEIILGLPAAGQSATGNYRLIGHCVNLLALRSYPKGEQSFKTYLKARTSAILDAYDHQLYTFGSLLKKLNISRDASRIPLVPVMFNIDMGMDDDVAFSGLKHHLISNPREYESFEIFVNISGRDEALVLEWSYNTQLFRATTIRNMMDEFEFLLRQLVADPDVLIENIPHKNAEALISQLKIWNNTEVDYPKDKALHQLISVQAQQYADSIAIKFNDTALTYKQLNEQANRFANLLIAQGVKKGDKVGFALDRSAEIVVVMLGIMKTGAIYVPLDPQFPLGRINHMLSDSAAVVLITSLEYKARYISNAKELVLENEWPSLNQYPATDPNIDVTGDDLVYILYTSGSTGLPKGVQIAHNGLINFLYSMQKAPGLTAADKLLAVTTVSFDISGLELFLPLISGAQVILADSESAKDGRALLDIIKKEGVTVMQATPYTWRIMLEAGWDETTPLKVICGGEALPKELSDRIVSRAASLWNVYGPTETTVWSTIKQIMPDDKLITVGRPIDNTSIYILDKFLNPLPAGTPGEIYIGGDGVAKGYLNQPVLTAERFIADPFAGVPSAKMYRTGDLGKFMPDGEIECLGRVDAQIKIRGYRIEAGEIEYNLANEYNVKEAVVIARADKSGVAKLVAYVVINDNYQSESDAAQIKGWRTGLRAQLPDYMVPDDFLIIPAMPLTPNGKVDKKALADQTTKLAESINLFIAPRTDIEKLVADIWSEFLEIKNIGIYDNFFELGGHSLIAVQVMTRIEKLTGKRLPLAALFENSTVEKLALMLEMDGKSIVWDSLVPIKPTGTKMPLYIVHGAGLNVLLFNTLASGMDDDQPVYGLQAKGLNGIEEPLSDIKDIAAHYNASIMEQNPTGPYALAGYSFGGIIAFEMAKQFEAMGKEVKMLAMFDTYAYRSPYYDGLVPMYVKRGKFFMRKVKYALEFHDGFFKTIAHNTTAIKRRITKVIWKLSKDEEQEGFFGYSNKIDEMNILAEKRYQLQPYPIAVELFRAENRTFYMDDFEFLGWKPYALKGVNVHKIPGGHNSIFKAPNDKIFASILQNCLNEAANR